MEGFLSRVWVVMVGTREDTEVVDRGRRCREDNGKGFAVEEGEIVE